MKAAVYRQTGPSSVLAVEEVPTPEPGPGEVRVKIMASGVNPTDWKVRSGAGRPPRGPQVPHQDGAGTVDAIGPGVEDRHQGQRVWVYLAAFANLWGTAAEYCVVPAERTVPLPEGASFELGASLGVPALTAAHCLGNEPASLRGAKVLVAGGAGAVGHFAIELAKQAGADVATTVSTEQKAKLAKAAGADLVVNYKHHEDALRQLKGFTPHFDRVVELAIGANLDLDLAVSGPGTVIAIYANEAQDPALPTRRLMAANVELHYVLLYGVPADELRSCKSWVSQALEEGTLTELPVVRFGLDDVAQAQDAVEGGALGKVLVVPTK